MFRILLDVNPGRKSCSRGSRDQSLEMWFFWLLFVLLWRKIKPMMCTAHIGVCGTEIGYCGVFQASLNTAGTEITARSFLLKIHQHPFILSAFTSAVGLDCGDSWQIPEGKALMGLVMLMEHGFPEPYWSFICLLTVVFCLSKQMLI